MRKLKPGDWLIVASALALLAGSFTTWFDVTLDFSSQIHGKPFDRATGWDVGPFWAGLPVVLGLAMAAVVVLRAIRPGTLPQLSIGWGSALFIAGSSAAGPVVLKLLVGQSDNGFPGLEVRRAGGLYGCAVAALGLVVGGWLHFQGERRTSAAIPPPALGGP